MLAISPCPKVTLERFPLPPEADLSYPAPKGVLRVLVKSGCNLRAADLNLSGASSDPYVVIEAALALPKKWEYHIYIIYIYIYLIIYIL